MNLFELQKKVILIKQHAGPQRSALDSKLDLESWQQGLQLQRKTT